MDLWSEPKRRQFNLSINQPTATDIARLTFIAAACLTGNYLRETRPANSLETLHAETL